MERVKLPFRSPLPQLTTLLVPTRDPELRTAHVYMIQVAQGLPKLQVSRIHRYLSELGDDHETD